ncbi:glycerophosphoryl diester phosphodiesterase membrane domain-containing protein [Alicyclobacillus pomorum]|uniref:glycerophosphoryl diester phosphodiesterase membrane domain-containing protein n=1 Tax=Alicyclobacillus pomorum TaxID=204470 RepID=UPI0004021639|nr:glycerophosphoryl diester phosphodiesterase membrane domain-containing protein [Alicyclobacillus pomorum]
MSTQPSRTHLRPQSIGHLLDDTFRTIGHHFRLMAVATLSIYLPYLVLQDIFSANVNALTAGMDNVQSFSELMTQLTAVLPQLIAYVVISILGALVAIPLLYGTMIHFLAKLKFEGETLTFKQAVGHAWRRLPAVIGTDLLKWIILLVTFVVTGGILALVIGLLGGIGAPAVVTGIVVTLLAIGVLCLDVWLLVKFALATPVAVMEGKAGWNAMMGSWRLIKGNFWRVLGYFILVQLIAGAVSFGLTTLFHLIPNTVVTIVLDSVTELVITPFTFVAISLLYLDLRVRAEDPDQKDW